MTVFPNPQRRTPTMPKPQPIPLLIPHGCDLPESDMTHPYPKTPFDLDVTRMTVPFVYLHGHLHDATDLFFVSSGEIPDFEDTDVRLVNVWDHDEKTHIESVMFRWSAGWHKHGLVVSLKDHEGLADAVEWMAKRRPVI